MPNVTATVLGLEVKTGTNKNGDPWTRYNYKLATPSGERNMSTFDDGLGSTVKIGGTYAVEYTEKEGQGRDGGKVTYRNIQSMTPTAQESFGAQPAQAAAPTPQQQAQDGMSYADIKKMEQTGMYVRTALMQAVEFLRVNDNQGRSVEQVAADFLEWQLEAAATTPKKVARRLSEQRSGARVVEPGPAPTQAPVRGAKTEFDRFCRNNGLDGDALASLLDYDKAPPGSTVNAVATKYMADNPDTTYVTIMDTVTNELAQREQNAETDRMIDGGE